MYTRFIAHLYSFTRRTELDREPSLMTTLLIVSAFQFLFLMGLGCLAEAWAGVAFSPTKVGALAVQSALLALNLVYVMRPSVRRRIADLDTARLQRRSDAVSIGFLLGVLAVFVLGCTQVYGMGR